MDLGPRLPGRGPPFQDLIAIAASPSGIAATRPVTVPSVAPLGWSVTGHHPSRVPPNSRRRPLRTSEIRDATTHTRSENFRVRSFERMKNAAPQRQSKGGEPMSPYVWDTHPPSGTTDAREQSPTPEIAVPIVALVRIANATDWAGVPPVPDAGAPRCSFGPAPGHRGAGIVGKGGPVLAPGDRKRISCISACGACEHCRTLVFSHDGNGGGRARG